MKAILTCPEDQRCSDFPQQETGEGVQLEFYTFMTNIVQTLCALSQIWVRSEPTDRGRYLFLFMRSKTRLWDSIKPVGSLCRPRHHRMAWGPACSIFPATARSLGECFWHKSGNYLLIWSPKELRARLTAKEKGISRESSTAVQRLQLLEGLESNVSKQPAVPIEVNFFRLFFLPEMSLLAQVSVTLSLFFSEVWRYLLTGADSMKHLLWGSVCWTEERKRKSAESAFLGKEGLILKTTLDMAIRLLNGYKSIFKRVWGWWGHLWEQTEVSP